MAASKGLYDQDKLVKLSKTYRQALSTAPAAAISVLAGSPFENIKTRMQSRHFPTAFTCVKYMYQTEGLRGFYAGLLGPMVNLTISRTLVFMFYRGAKYEVDRIMEKSTGSSPLQHVNKVGTYPSLSTVTCFTVSGMAAGAIQALLTSPFELIKTCTQTSVLMASGSNKAANVTKGAGKVSSYSAARQILRERGPLGLFIGFRLHLVRDVVGSGIFFGVYEAVKQAVNSGVGAGAVNSNTAIAMAGAVCGVTSGMLTYPLDTMKTQAQNRLVGAAAKDVLSTAAKQAAKSAAHNLSKWKGVEIFVLRSAVQNAVQMSLFEKFKVYIDELSFSDGTKTLPEVERELGRDQKKTSKNNKL